MVSKEMKQMDIEDNIDNFFAEGGILSRSYDNFEYRQPQEEMSKAVLRTLKERSHIFIEAPTGVGKSFAYLVPAIFYAKQNKKKVIVSTHTINLQEQLINKDIPFLKKVFPVEFKAMLLKGRKNYLCPRRLARALDSMNNLFESDEQLELEKIHEWAKRSKDGTRSDINFKINENVWNLVCSERGICTQKTCGYEGTNCFYYKARKEINDADVIIVNHHLFFTLFDGISEDAEGYLYKNDFVIFDEAQTVEAVATEHIAPTLSREMIKYHLLRLYNQRTQKGFLLDLPSLHIQPGITNLIEMNHYFFFDLRKNLFTMNGGRLEKLTSRIYEKGFTENTLKPEFEKLLDQLRSLRLACKNEYQENELNEYVTRFTEFNYILDEFITQKNNTKDDEYVYWVELSSRRPESNVSICSSPVDVSEYFKKNIFRPNNTTIFTSATLTVNNSFDYIKTRLGADNVAHVKLESPFDFNSQVKIFIPSNILTPSKEHNELYIENLKDWIYHFIRITNGKALVLFTNSFILNSVAENIKEVLMENEIELLKQDGTASRSALLKYFKHNVNSVLFGLDSFWMGIDVPGDSLSNLIITRLPFQVPDHPVVQAKMEFIERNGGNSFLDYSLPEAILKFRQGIGRLIRKKTDKGIIAILDNRIIKKFYGKYFFNSIEECEVEIIDDIDDI